MDLLVIAKEPRPGRVKTRLSPPCTPEQAAAVAEAALADTLDAARASGADRVVLALDGEPGAWLPPGVTVIDQGSGDLTARLHTVWRAASGAAVQIGMDTPQVTPALLDDAMARLERGAPSVLGHATDGGWWAIGFRTPRPDAFAGIPTSRADTGARQQARLEALGLEPELLPALTDVDNWPDARAAAALVPLSRFARTVRAVAATPA